MSGGPGVGYSANTKPIDFNGSFNMLNTSQSGSTTQVPAVNPAPSTATAASGVNDVITPVSPQLQALAQYAPMPQYPTLSSAQPPAVTSPVVQRPQLPEELLKAGATPMANGQFMIPQASLKELGQWAQDLLDHKYPKTLNYTDWWILQHPEIDPSLIYRTPTSTESSTPLKPVNLNASTPEEINQAVLNSVQNQIAFDPWRLAEGSPNYILQVYDPNIPANTWSSVEDVSGLLDNWSQKLKSQDAPPAPPYFSEWYTSS